MTRRSDVDRAAIALFDRFTHEGLDRRTFMAELTRLAGGTAAATALLASLAPQAAAAPIVPANHPALRTGEEWMNAGTDRLLVYRVRQAVVGRGRRGERPAILVIHENRGLNEHIRDVARRLALGGYDALAPDFLSMDGGRTPADEDAAREAIGALDLARTTAAGAGLIDALHRPQPGARGRRVARKVGVVGFCWGGATVHRLALASGASLGAGVSFYGPAPEPAQAARLQVPLLVILAGRDERVNRTALPYVAAGERANRTIRAITYPDVDHAFHNDSSAVRYNPAAAQLAWQETLTFFQRHLS